ncbi:restriction endonuclease subunit S [Polaribacter sp. BAL334]|uniref:restriction endonuclease subunit S n=1 Tax=Polaribacter sp. BAL334 TaxID=1708178 RepID=UPI0018D216C9|nr:restriction endonuclease subunit S [Polaribacter sp. BAL334]MBG7612272.1 restriction endonuclease subunit S [Polaribacter sp. BAL334]
MGRGRKPISNFNGSEWETVFYNSVGTYVQYINIQLSKEYKLEPLSNHLKIVGGYAFKTAEYKNQGIPIIRISDFNNEQIVLKDVVYYQEAKELDRYQLVEGDIIIALTGGTIAKLAIVQNGLGKIYLNQRVGKFQALKPDEFEVEYIYWLARSIQSIIKNLAWGAAIPNVSPKQIEALKFPFPTKETQRGIIDFLNDLKNNDLKEDKIYFDVLIENEIVALHEKQFTTSSISIELTHQLTLLKKLRQQLLQDAVQGKLVAQNKKDEPASELLKKIKAEKKFKKELPPLKPEELSFEIPSNWTWCRLGEIAEIVRGGSPRPAGDPTFYGGAIPFLKVGDLTGYEDIYVRTHTYSIKEAGLHKTRFVEADTLMLTNSGATLGIPRICTFPTTFNDGIAAFLNLNNIDKVYLYYFLKSKSAWYLKEASRGQGQPNLNTDIIALTPFPLPPLNEQKRIVDKLEQAMQNCNNLEENIKQSESQNEKLLQQVLREALRKGKKEVVL